MTLHEQAGSAEVCIISDGYGFTVNLDVSTNTSGSYGMRVDFWGATLTMPPPPLAIFIEDGTQ